MSACSPSLPMCWRSSLRCRSGCRRLFSKKEEETLVKIAVRFALFVALAVAAVALSGAAEAAVVTLHVADVQANTAYETGLKSFAAKVEAATEGRVTVQV